MARATDRLEDPRPGAVPSNRLNSANIGLEIIDMKYVGFLALRQNTLKPASAFHSDNSAFNNEKNLREFGGAAINAAVRNKFISGTPR